LTRGKFLRLANRGEIPRVVFPNREVRFDQADLSQFVDFAQAHGTEGRAAK